MLVPERKGKKYTIPIHSLLLPYYSKSHVQGKNGDQSPFRGETTSITLIRLVFNCRRRELGAQKLTVVSNTVIALQEVQESTDVSSSGKTSSERNRYSFPGCKKPPQNTQEGFSRRCILTYLLSRLLRKLKDQISRGNRKALRFLRTLRLESLCSRSHAPDLFSHL